MAFWAVMVNCFVAVAEAESVMLTVKVEGPGDVAIPVIVPTGDRLKPAGRLPADTAHVYGGVPAVALNAHTVPETAFPTIGLGRAAVVMDTCPNSGAAYHTRASEDTICSR